MQNTQFNHRQSSYRTPARQVPQLSRPTTPQPAPSTRPVAPAASASSDKQVTLRTLAKLKQRLYVQAAVAANYNPQKADLIRKRVDREASYIAFVINTLSVKL